MNTYPIQKLSDAMGGKLILGGGDALVESGVSTDTRSLVPGALFVALSGENFDAHDFLDQAVDAGAAGLVVRDLPDGLDSGRCAVIQVNDTLLALQKLAHWYRGKLDVVVIGITGSNGKTSTKDFVIRDRTALPSPCHEGESQQSHWVATDGIGGRRRR